MTYIVRLETQSPVLIAQHRGTGNVVETLDYIPGTTWRGALAGAYLKTYEADAAFRRLFCLDRVRFGNLYKEGAIPVPATASSCKLEPGFLSSGHGVVDRLVLAAQLQRGQGDPSQYDECSWPECGVAMDRFGGYYKKESEGYTQVEVDRRMLVRTAIEDCTETARSGMLYTLVVLEEGQAFEGTLTADKTSAEAVRELLKGCAGLVRIGSAKTRGLGTVHIAIEGERPQPLSGMKERFSRLNEKVGDGKTCFSLTLRSDVILLDRLLRYRTFIGVDDLQRWTRTLEEEQRVLWATLLGRFELRQGFGSTRIVSGWNAAPNIQLPKEDEVSVKAGSVFLYGTDGALNQNERDTLTAFLDALEADALGERVNEGFGLVCACDPFHTAEEEVR